MLVVLKLCVLLFAAQESPDLDSWDLPQSVDLSSSVNAAIGAPRDQGVRLSCTSFAIVAVAGYEAHLEAGRGKRVFLEEYLLWAAREIETSSNDALAFFQATAALDQLGLVKAKDFGYELDAYSHRTMTKKVLRKSEEWRARWTEIWVRRFDDESSPTDSELYSLCKEISQGHPVAVGMFWPLDDRISDIMEVIPREEVFGGHTVVVVGYCRDEAFPGGGYFQFRNSRGDEWGEGGYGRISFAYAKEYFNDMVGLRCWPKGHWEPKYVFEAEDLRPVTSTTSEDVASDAKIVHAANLWRGIWSGDSYMHLPLRESGASAVYAFDLPRSGDYRLGVFATAARDYGVIQIELNGEPVTEVDLYSSGTSPSGRIAVDSNTLDKGENTITLRVVRKHPKSEGYGIGLDRIELVVD